MKYAFLGAGKMAHALIHGMLRAELCPADNITVASRSTSGLESLVAATSIRAAASNADAVTEADVVVLCVKPTDAIQALEQVGPAIQGKLLVSVVTGLTIKQLEAAAQGSRAIRAMPNTAAMVGQSATALASGGFSTHEDMVVATGIFEAVGNVVPVAESQLDAVTGLSGSGPAYIYLIMEALSDGGVAMGLPRKLALELAIQTVAGAAEMARSTSEHPAILREMVTSPGGTTIAGLTALENAGTRAAMIAAVRAAATRSQELAAGR
jgi:pyrroline-5-carboxylate reductase